jgi:hypothetical protein
MRVIEQDMITALETKVNWSKDNTRVVYNPNADTSDIYLFGHHIASMFHKLGDLIVNRDTLRSYPTRTTKSRLRALYVDVSTNRGITYLNGEAV